MLHAAHGSAELIRAAESDLAGAKIGPDDDLKALRVEAEKTLTLTKDALHPPSDGWKGERVNLDAKNVQAALNALQPKAKKKTTAAKDKDAKSATEDGADGTDLKLALLGDLVAGIKARNHRALAEKALALDDKTLDDAIADAERRADEFAKRGKEMEYVMEEFDALVDRQLALSFEFQQILAQLKSGSDKVHDVLEKRAEALRALNAQLQGDYQAARDHFSAVRYEADARSNQDSAYLFEVKALVSAARSDNHLERSKLFLFAMLMAQAAVTISTLALAVKRRSVFWLLATLTGLASIIFGAIVYLGISIPGF